MTASTLGRAWSCTVRLVVDDDAALTHAAADLFALLEQVDRAASRFRPDSELSRANAHPGRPVAVSPLLAELVGDALRMAAHTGGAVDPTVGRAVQRLGYDRDIAEVAPDGPAVAPQPPARDWRDVRLDPAAGLLSVPPGTELDLGATAKSATADRAARTLAARYGTAVLVELGGDLAVAGERADAWCVRVAEHGGGDGELVSLRGGGLTTSTTTVRRWRRDGRAVSHIVDPRTGASADGPWRTATVAAGDALHANAASTAAIVLGDAAPGWLESHGYAARLVARTGTVARTSGWPSAPVLTGASR